jgi:hypothetical protein
MSSIRPIQPSNVSSQGSSSVRGPQGAGAASGASSSAPKAATSAPRDRVELSAEGRALARASTLDAGRTESIRQKVLTGAYDNLNVIDQVARRMLAKGDV